MKSLFPNSIVLPVYFLGTIAAFSLVIGAILLLYHYTMPAPIDTSRYEERRKNLAELQAQAAHELDHYAYLDEAKGRIRLPIQRAMELCVEEWRNPAAGRSNLLRRVRSAFPPVPPAEVKP